MKAKNGKRAPLLAALSIIILLAGGGVYLSRMKLSLWEQSVSNVLEVTIQGGKSFEVYVEQGHSMMEGRAANFAQYNSDDIKNIGTKLGLYEDGDPSFAAIDLDRRIIYFNRNEISVLPEETAEYYLSLPRYGVLKPFISEHNGCRVLGYYERFTFADGTEGMVRKTVLLSDVSEQFALSFYDGAGFSYVVDSDGDIILRSGSENGNRTFSNIFDVISMDENNTYEDAEAFRRGMSGDRRGVMQLGFDGREHIFAFVPLSVNDGWYFVSVVPNDVIMERADNMMMRSQVMMTCAAAGMLILSAFLLLGAQHRSQVRAKDSEVLYREKLFNLLANDTNDVFLIISSDFSRVEYVSPNVERVVGVPCEEVSADLSCLQSVIHGNSHEDEVSAHLDIPLGGSAAYEGKYVHKRTGEMRWFVETVYHTMAEDTERYIVIIADRSEERRKEETLTEALHIAEIANESKSTFLANMSHDIRTPMNTIVGLTALLNRDAENSAKVREHTEKITSSSKHLLGLINDVLDMSKIENGKTSLNIGEFSLPALIGELDSIIRLQAGAKKQTFEIKVRDIHNEELIGDRQRISQALMNILSNAVKYTPEGGHVSLEVKQLGLANQGMVRIVFEVSDNGIGMSEEYQREIFSPFTREVRTTVNQVQGTGLGMAITKNLVELMGGTISVKSERGEGSVFTIELDLRVKSDNEAENFWKEHSITKALVVDDEADICAEILGAMEGTGVDMQFALDGASAVDMVKRANSDGEDFSLILLDWKMPGMDGLETAKRIRAELSAHIPIVALTAYDWEDIKDDGLSAGIDGFMPKPFFLSSLKEAVRSAKNKDNAPADESENISISGLRFLCAEDNELNAEILAEILDMEGASADIASDGKKAVDMFSAAPAGRYDAVLMDVQMPVMNGYEATRAIRKLDHPQAKTVPIVAMTANAFADDVRDALESGMNEHLAKPLDIKKLIEVLSRLCGEK